MWLLYITTFQEDLKKYFVFHHHFKTFSKLANANAVHMLSLTIKELPVQLYRCKMV